MFVAQTDSLCPTIKAFISSASCHRSSNQSFSQFFPRKASNCRGCCIITFVSWGQGPGNSRPGPAILYQGLMDLQHFKEKKTRCYFRTLWSFFLDPPKKNVNVGWLTQKTTSLFGHFLSEFAWGKLIKSTKSTAVMCTCFLNALILFTDFHLPILPFRRTWHPIFNGVLFTPTKPNHIQCPSHRDGDRQGDTLHSSLFLFSDVRWMARWAMASSQKKKPWTTKKMKKKHHFK